MTNISTKHWFAATCTAFLTACGSTTTPPVNVAPLTQSLGPDVVLLAYDAVTMTYAVTVNGVDQSGLSLLNTTASHGPMVGLIDATGTKHAAVAQTDHSLIYVAATNSATTPFAAIAYGRLTDTALPTSGSASFAGTYAGMFRRADVSPANTVLYRIRGNAALDANFGANTVSGSIINRKFYDLSGVWDTSFTLSDVALASGSIDATGGFSGLTSGGQITGGAWLETTGAYQGVFAGPTAGEAVGGVLIDHAQLNANPFIEIGGFFVTN